MLPRCRPPSHHAGNRLHEKLRWQERSLVISNAGRSRRCREKNQCRLRETLSRRSRCCARSLRSRKRARIGSQPGRDLKNPREATDIKVGISNESAHDACMKIATIIARVLLGLVFVVFGSNIFLHLIPMPPPPPGLLGDFTKALFLSHYLHVVAVFQIVGGLLLLIGRFVPLGLVLLAPVIVNIDLVHILLDPSGLPMAAVISILLVFLIWRYRDAFKGILKIGRASCRERV